MTPGFIETAATDQGWEPLFPLPPGSPLPTVFHPCWPTDPSLELAWGKGHWFTQSALGLGFLVYSVSPKEPQKPPAGEQAQDWLPGKFCGAGAAFSLT